MTCAVCGADLPRVRLCCIQCPDTEEEPGPRLCSAECERQHLDEHRLALESPAMAKEIRRRWRKQLRRSIGGAE